MFTTACTSRRETEAKLTSSKRVLSTDGRFPLCDPDRLKQWLKNMGRKKWTPSASSHLCSTHFEDDQFLSDRNVNKRLKTTAVPTIFIHPPHFATQTRATKTRATETRATKTRATETRATETRATETRATETRATETRATQSRSTQTIATHTIATQTEWVNVKMEVSESMVLSFVPSCSSTSYIAELHRGPGPGAHLCSVLDSDPVTNIDIKDRGSIPSPDYSNRGVGLGVDRGLSTQGSYVRRAPKDARMNSCGYREGPIENAFLQGPGFCATPLYSIVSVKQEPAEETVVVVKQEPAEETHVVVKQEPAEETHVVVKQEPAEDTDVVVKREPAEETHVVVKQEPAEETDVIVKQEPAEETDVVVKQEPAEETHVVVKQEPAEETDVVVKREPAEETDVVVKQEPAEETDVVVKQEPAEETDVVVKQEPAEETHVVVKQEPAEETHVVVKQEPAEETHVVVKREPAEETHVVDTVLPDYIVKFVIKADVNEAAAEDNADVDEFAADDITENTTSRDSKTVILDHGYFSKKQKEIHMLSDHMYVISESPIILKRRVNELCGKLVEARKKFKLKCQETRRMKSKLISLKILTKGLQKKLNSLQKKLKAMQKCRPNGGTVQNVQEPFLI